MKSEVKPIVTEHTTDWHWWAFSDFCKKKALVKEPSPHMQMIGQLTEGKSREEVIWFTGLYAAFYNIPSALVMWHEWPWDKALEHPEDIKEWLNINWKGVTTRTERRTVRSVANMNESILSYIKWANGYLPEFLSSKYHNNNWSQSNYDIIWENAEENLRFMGRYIIIRLLEGLHRFAGLEPKLYDIRSIGGWSPKRALGLLYPEQLGLLLSSDTRENVFKVDALARKTIDRFRDEFDLDMSEYVFAAMLCEYRVAYENRRQYPFWTGDQEPAYWYKTREFWLENRGEEFVKEIEEIFFSARAELFPEVCLGEIQGWNGTRIEPRSVLRNYGYNWSDIEFDYLKTKEIGDFSKPVTR